MLRTVEIEGFKSFGTPARRIELRPLTFIVGANGSGKTNFLNGLRFLKNAVTQDVPYAVDDLGGVAEVRCKLQRQRQEQKPLRLVVELDDTLETVDPQRNQPVQVQDISYKLLIDLRTNEHSPVILEESLKATLLVDRERREYLLTRDKSKVSIKDPLHPTVTTELSVPEKEQGRPALSVGFFSLPAVLFRHVLQDWSFFNISPHVARQSYRELPDSSLGRFGENLSVVLHRIQTRNGDSSLEEIINNVRGVVPGFDSVEPVRTELEGRWALKLKEKKLPGSISPESISDGTIRLLALMVIANLRSRLVAIEEPENSLHPHLSGHLVNVFREASSKRQIIATTHNPAYLDHLEPEEVILCAKQNGLTKLRRASDANEITTFRKHFTLGELWVQGKLDFEGSDDE